MQFTIRDVSKFFNVSERTVYRWIDQNAIPAYKINEQYRFNKAELVEWATAKRINMSPEIFSDGDSDRRSVMPALYETVDRSGIHYRIEGEDRDSVIKNMLNIIKLPEGADKDLLFSMLIAREKLASTGVGDGIALPHIRNPVIINISAPLVSICFLEKPIEFGALDGKPVFCFFSVICPTMRMHLHLLSRIGFVLRDEGLKKTLKNQAPRAEIIERIKKTEGKIRLQS